MTYWIEPPDRMPDLELVGYLERWCLVPRSKLTGSVYLHHFLAPDAPVLHDHPWNFRSLILRGSYIEQTQTVEVIRRTGDSFEKKATDLHYIKEICGDAWTLIVTEPVSREWGFVDSWTGGWVHHNDYRGPNRSFETIKRNGYE